MVFAKKYFKLMFRNNFYGKESYKCLNKVTLLIFNAQRCFWTLTNVKFNVVYSSFICTLARNAMLPEYFKNIILQSLLMRKQIDSS